MPDPRYISRGKMQVMVLREDEFSPIEGARVRVSDPADGQIVWEDKTDSSGQTAATDLPAPPLEDSLTETGQRPYAVYTVTVDASDRERQHISGVQVYPERRSVQTCRLRPAVPGGFNLRNLSVEPNGLWNNDAPKIPEEEIKPLPPPSGQVVLPEAVIPEYVVVHLGRPRDTSAENRWVRFTDYIKNVICCEIFPTWNDAALRANVLAVISFTLNRVYTEWYRGKGYDFTITNSTSYDQSYRPGTTIFANVSQIVDELFATYMTRSDGRQPLLAQYCDGREVQCQGLSQWGSQALAQQGQSAENILRRYYGSDIRLVRAAQVEGVPRSYGGEVLSIGSTGPDVRTVQSQLNAIANDFPAIGRLQVDGIFGPRTAASVRTFQQVFQSSVTGTVDYATWYAISNIYVSVTGLAR